DDWYDNQYIQLKNGALQWKEIAEKPGTSGYSAARNGSNDELHIVVIDDSGKISGATGAILEKFTFLSKADDAKNSFGDAIYYKDHVSERSNNIFIGIATGNGSIASGIITAFTPSSTSDNTWSQDAQDVNFNFVGNKLYELQGGKDYSGVSTEGGYSTSLGNIIGGYEIFENEAEYSVNFLLNGPGITGSQTESQAKANKLIAIAEQRKDCLAVISPNRETVVNITNAKQQTKNVIQFYDPITSSSFAVFDSGYKYQFDRFNNAFRFMPLNGDIGGLMARTSEEQFPWFSPAGPQRGNILNTVKLAYNPNKTERDSLYVKRINPVIFSPGGGFLLFGDKTGLAIASAFDRINVRRLFLNLEARIEIAARTQLFEFNDEITRANFRNIVE
ncbi:MAG: phage tail sheath subtilisin-like domain-containing protein, partial [Pseudomonadota bacterium]|nr:phage tail sheath subtilisin-like domain-containing protein [Pseudomonadota bacterium]